MAVKMILFWISLVVTIIGSNAAGELTILHSPESLKFSGSSRTLESLLKEIFSASLGLSVEENSEWNGLTVVNPFNTPEAVVEVYIDGISSLGIASPKTKSYPLTVDEYEPDTFNAVSHRIKQRFSNGGSKLVNAPLSDFNELSTVFGDFPAPKVSKITLQHLRYSIEEDYQFLSELEALKIITAKVKAGKVSPDNIADFYNFRFRSLHALSDFHGPNSLQTKEAKKLLGETLQSLSQAFVNAYDGSVLVTAVSTDVAHTRRVRQAPNPVEVVNEDRSSDKYSSDYAAIFNIILWFGVVMAFTMIAIVYAITDMDPGRDSIIYRMTSMKMKKDN